MKKNYSKRRINYWMNVFLMILLTIFLYKILDNMDGVSLSISTKVMSLKKILSPFFIAIFVAYLLNPFVGWFESNVFDSLFKSDKTKKYSRILSTLLVFILVIGAISLTLVWVMPRMVMNLTDLISRLPDFIYENETRIIDWINHLYDNDVYNIASTIEENINEWFSNIGELLQKSLNNVLSRILAFTSGMLNMILGLIISFYLLVDKADLIKGIDRFLRAILKDEQVDYLKEFCKEANNIFIKYFIGKSLDSFIIACICFIGLTFMKSPYIQLISIIVGITNMIPYFGPLIGEMIAFIIISFYSPQKALGVFIFLFILQQFDGLILAPKILGKKVGVKPIWIIFSIMLGGGLFGVLGMFLGVPAIAILGVLLGRFITKRIEMKEEKRGNTKS